MITIWSSTQPNASSGLTNWTSWGTELVHTALGHWRIGFALSATFPNLGLVNFYDRFIPHCASLLEPVNRHLKTSGDSTRQFVWDESAATAFTTIKDALAVATLLVHPKSHACTYIMADASDSAVGAVLQQNMRGMAAVRLLFEEATAC